MVKLSEWLQNVTTSDKARAIILESENRIVRAYKELLRGYEFDPRDIINVVAKVKKHEGLVVERDIFFTSICGHHFLPFLGTIDIVYEPDKKIAGLGKLPRVADHAARKFHLQEFLVREIAEVIQDTLEPKGVFVRSIARHLCICSRGPSSQNAETVCTYALGTLKDPKRQQIVQNELRG